MCLFIFSLTCTKKGPAMSHCLTWILGSQGPVPARPATTLSSIPTWHWNRYNLDGRNLVCIVILPPSHGKECVEDLEKYCSWLLRKNFRESHSALDQHNLISVQDGKNCALFFIQTSSPVPFGRPTCTKNSSGTISVPAWNPPAARFQRVCALLALFLET